MINKDRLIKLTQKVLQFNSVNPPGNEWELAQFIIKDLKSIKLDVKTVSYKPKRPNVIATLKGTWPREKAAAESILITPHIDTVPFGTGWKFDPIGGEVRAAAFTDAGQATKAIARWVWKCCDPWWKTVKLKRDIVLLRPWTKRPEVTPGIRPLLKSEF
jgi:succinyl-diaminopimelate desuccinylase